MLLPEPRFAAVVFFCYPEESICQWDKDEALPFVVPVQAPSRSTDGFAWASAAKGDHPQHLDVQPEQQAKDGVHGMTQIADCARVFGAVFANELIAESAVCGVTMRPIVRSTSATDKP